MNEPNNICSDTASASPKPQSDTSPSSLEPRSAETPASPESQSAKSLESVAIVTYPAGTQLPLHPLATLFPRMSDADRARTRDHIKENGLLEPITTLNGQVLDGANRQAICAELGIPLTTREFTGPGHPVQFVWGKNAALRHLSEKQRSAVGAKFVELISDSKEYGAAEALAKLPKGGMHVRDHVAEMMNVSSRSVGSALKVLKEGAPELFAKIESSEIAPSVAEVLTALPKEEQAALVESGPKAMREAAKHIRVDRPSAQKPTRRSKPVTKERVAGGDQPAPEGDSGDSAYVSVADNDWLIEIEHETGIWDTPSFAIDAQLSRRVHAMLEAEVALAQKAFAAQNLSPRSAPFYLAACEFLDVADARNWHECECVATAGRPRADENCAQCRAAGYLVKGADDRSAASSGAEPVDSPVGEALDTTDPPSAAEAPDNAATKLVTKPPVPKRARRMPSAKSA